MISTRTAEIASAAASCDMTHGEIAEAFGVSRARVSAIARSHGLVRSPGRRRTACAMKDLAAFFDAKAAWSRSTFGKGHRAGVIVHIRDELKEIESDPRDLTEWIDVVLLAMDGAARSAGADGAAFVAALIAKQQRNTRRSWPSGMPPDAATHHLKE